MSAQLERLLKRLEAIPEGVKDAVKPALAKSGAELVDFMRALAPEETGALKASLTITMPGEATPPYSQPGGARIAGPTEVIVTAGNAEVRYPHLVEFGSTAAPAQPFFWPAFRLTRARIQRRIKRAIGKAVREEWNK